MRQRLAKLTSTILNPFLVSFLVIVLLAFDSTSSIADAVKWSLISLVLSVLPVFSVVVYLVRNKKINSFNVQPREQRTRIYVLASALAIISCIILFVLEAPELLRATFVSGLIAIVVFMAINLFWKISLHTAFVAASVTILIIVYGSMAAWTLVLLLLVVWARIEMRQHSPAQMATGALLAAGIVVLVFWRFGLMGAQI
jgi:membrane-associated phospholipid phosphatase